MQPHGGGKCGSTLLRPTLRTGLLTLTLLVGALTLLPLIDLQLAPLGTELDWWAIAIVSLGVELLAFDVEFRREVYTFTFSEIPLVLGLFLASPAQLIIGRAVGELIFLVVKSRQPFRKWSLNLASFTAECAVTLAVAHSISNRDLHIDQPLAWLSALVAVSAADLVSFVVVALAVRWHGGSLRFGSILSIGALTAPVNTSLALIAALLATTQPWATLLLGGIAGFLALSYRSYTASTRRFESLSLLYDFTKLVTSGQNPDDALAAMLNQTKNLLGAERAEVWLIDDNDHHFALVVDDDERIRRDLPAATQTLLDEWFGDGHDARIATAESRDPSSRAIATALSADNCVVAPLTDAGSIIGMVAVVNRLGKSRRFRNQDRALFESLAGQASIALDNGRLIVRLHEQKRQRAHDATHDPLTGLANRAHFEASIGEALASQPAVGVAIVDLDGFREINDTLGRESGDRVLVEVARRLTLAVDEKVTVARVGADEYGLLINESAGRERLELVARHVRSALTFPMLVGNISVHIASSAGVAVAPRDGRDPKALLAKADLALQDAKAGSGLAFYDAGADTTSLRRLSITHELSDAIENGGLWVAYQPKVRLADGVVTGLEALARWNHPVHGPIRPDEFIPVAERTGAVRALTEHVLSSAVAQAAAWRRDGREWNVAVNLSMRSLHDPELVDTVRRALAEHALAPSQLTLEITESNVMSDPDRTIRLLNQLAHIGVQLSVDDFGTGYSSLSYLQRLPVHEMKIDKSFILSMAHDRASTAIVCSILDLARNMGLSVVAEGIEERETWDRLQRLACVEGQGYYMAAPVPAGDVLDAAERIAALELAPRRLLIAR